MDLKQNKKRLEVKLQNGEPIYKLNFDPRDPKGLIPMTLTKVGNKYGVFLGIKIVIQVDMKINLLWKLSYLL